MNQSSIDNSKKKFTHSNSRVIFSETFFDHHKTCYLIQCESWEVIIGETDSKFKLLWKGTVKQKITCIAHCHKQGILYAGTNKGAIASIDFRNDQSNYQKIDSIDGEPVLAMFAYTNDATQLPELNTLNKTGKFRNYKNNKYSASVTLPFRVSYAISNKTIKSKNDVAIVILKEKGTFPYIFSPQFFIELLQIAQARGGEQMQNVGDIASKKIGVYQQSLHYEADEQVRTEEVSFIAISNSKAVLVVSVGPEVSVYSVVKNGEWLSVVPDFKFKVEEEVTKIDVVDSCVLYLSSRGISTYDLQKRRKVAKGLIFKGSQYDIIHWAELGSSILYGSTKAPKMKMILCQLKGVSQQ